MPRRWLQSDRTGKRPGVRMSSDYANKLLPDLTAASSPRGAGMNMGILWLCGHRAPSTGALYRKVPGMKPLAWKCAACVAKKTIA